MKKLIFKLQKAFLLIMAFMSFCTVSVFGAGIPTYTPGLCTVKNFLSTAVQPVGSTMYIWGGGWFKHESKKGDITYGSDKIGVYQEWKEFYKKQKTDYDFCKYAISENGVAITPLPEYVNAGLDCSGFVGWTVYNTLNTENGKQGFVCKAKTMAKIFSEEDKFGEYKDFGKVTSVKPGDVISISNKSHESHVYIAVGQCEDGSIVTVESAPPGVQIRGTQNHNGSFESEAVKLAETYMAKYYPEWYAKFPNCKCNSGDYRGDSQMSWKISETSVMKDPDGYIKMNLKEILKDLFGEK